MKESSGNPLAKNPNSTAFGLGQLLVGNRHKYARMVGVKPNTTDPVEQIALFRSYVDTRYGSAGKALEFHLANNWY